MNRPGGATPRSSILERLLIFGTPPNRTRWSICFYGNVVGVFIVPLLIAPSLILNALLLQPGSPKDRILSGFSVNASAWLALACVWLGTVAFVVLFWWIRSVAKRTGSWQGV
jgi:hypothetical protein